MKKTIVLLLSIATIIGCMSLPAAAAYKKTVWMSTAYYNSYMADKAHVKFTTSSWQNLSFRIGLRGSDNKIRGDKKYMMNLRGTATKDSSPVDHDFHNMPYLKIF